MEHYDEMIGEYFQKLEHRGQVSQWNAQVESNKVIQEIRKNEKAFHEMKNKSKIGQLLPNPKELALLKPKRRPSREDAQRTSWADLSAANFRSEEEHSVKAILGIAIDAEKTEREPGASNGLGGGGNPMLRKGISSSNLE